MTLLSSLATGKAPAGRIESVTLLGHKGNLEFTQDAEGLKVKIARGKAMRLRLRAEITGLKLK